MTVKEIELRRQMDKLARDAQAIHVEASKAGRDLTAEERAKFDKMFAEVMTTKQAAEAAAADETRMKELASINAEANKELEERAKMGDPEAQKKTEYKKAFRSYVYGQARIQETLEVERRAFVTTADNVGGIAIPTDVYPLMEVAQKPWQAMVEAADIIRTSSGAPLKMTSINDTGAKAVISGQATPADADATTPFGGVTLGGWIYNTKTIAISYELFQDAAIDIQAILMARMGERFGRAFNYDSTLGGGTSLPMGIINALVTAATNMHDTASGTALAYDDLRKVPFYVYAPYRAKGAWMMSDGMISAIAGLVDDDHRPLWLPTFGSMNTGGNGWTSSLLGWPVISNLEMLAAVPSIAGAGNYGLMFGDFKAYKARYVGGPRIIRLDEVLAQSAEVGFIGYQRFDGNYLDAGTHPVALLRFKTT